MFSISLRIHFVASGFPVNDIKIIAKKKTIHLDFVNEQKEQQSI